MEIKLLNAVKDSDLVFQKRDSLWHNVQKNVLFYNNDRRYIKS